jgi:Sulfotransferase family
VKGNSVDTRRVIISREVQPTDKIVFMHIPKCAGTSFWKSLSAVYGSSCIRHEFFDPVTPGSLEPYRAICGHFSLHDPLYDAFKGPFVHWTILRRPVERVVSNYLYIRRRTDHPQHDEANKRSLKEILASGDGPRFGLSNQMAKQITNQLEPTLQHAKWCLEFCFTDFGFVHRYDDFFSECKLRMNWTFSEPLHENSDPPEDFALDTETLRLIVGNNQVDIDLYDFARILQLRRNGGQDD